MLKRLLLILAMICFATDAFAQLKGRGGGSGSLTIGEEDGNPSSTFTGLLFSNGTLTDNGDGTVSISNVGAEVDTLNTVCDRGCSYDAATDFASGMDITDGSGDGLRGYVHATQGPVWVPYCNNVENDCDQYRTIGSGHKAGFKDSSGNIDFEYTESSGQITALNTNAETSGVTITLPFKHNFKMVGCAGTTGTLLLDSNAALAPTPTCTEGTTNTTSVVGYAVFPDSDGEYQVQDSFQLPADFSASDAIDVDAIWRTAATSGDVVLQVQTFCTSNTEVEDVAWNAASTGTDTAHGTTLQINHINITNITKTNCAALDYIHFKFMRQRTHASDTLANTFQLRNAEVTIRRGM